MRALVRSWIVIVALCVPFAPAWAQPARPERPYRGLFASAPADLGQSLIATASVSGGYDDDLEADATGSQGSSGSDSLRRSGTLGSFNGSLAYELSSERFNFGTNASTGVRYYPSLEFNEFVHGSQGRMALTTRPGTSTTVSAATSVSYRPYSFATLFPVLFDPQVADSTLPDLDVAVTPGYYLSYDGDVGFSHRMSRRASMSAAYGYRVSEYTHQEGQFTYQTAGGQFLYDIGKGLVGRAGYTFSEARLSADVERIPLHQIDAGVDYNRTLSFSRRTRLSFSTGTSATRARNQLRDDIRYRATGTADLTHESGRTWTTAVGYGRRVELSETWLQPVFYDSVSARLTGLFSRRLRFLATANGSVGNVGTLSVGSSFEAYYAHVGVDYAISRFVAVGAVYSYYHHRFDRGVVLPIGALRESDRHSIRVGVNMWAPLMQRARRGDATR